MDTGSNSSSSSSDSGIDEPNFTRKSGEGWDFSLVNYDYSVVLLGNADSFVVFDEASKYLSISDDVTQPSDEGEYFIEAYKLNDDSLEFELILKISLTIVAETSDEVKEIDSSIDLSIGLRYESLINA